MQNIRCPNKYHIWLSAKKHFIFPRLDWSKNLSRFPKLECIFEQPPSQFEYFWLECKYKFFSSDSDIHLVALSKVISKLENDAARKNNLRLGHWRNIKNDGSLHASSLNSCLLSYFKINIFNRKSEEASTCKHRFCVRQLPRKIDQNTLVL